MPNNATFVKPGTLKGLSIAVLADDRTLSLQNNHGDATANILNFVQDLLRLADSYGLKMGQVPIKPHFVNPNVGSFFI